MPGTEFQFLKSIDILSGLDDQLIRFLASRLHKKRFRKGEHIFFQGDVVSHFYFVEMGRVEIYKSDMDGRKLTLWFVDPKDTFCLASLHTSAAFANALVIEDAMLYTLKEKDFDDFVAQSGEISTRFVYCMSKKMALYSAMLEDMAFKGIMARLAKVLLEYQKKDDVSGTAFCSLTQGELASLVGSCREVVARSLKKLRDDGIISTSQSRQIVIIQPDRLKRLCD
ncbi:MAG: Crp/Fnr family transcriptional regulator [Deltaproteobacteria bacterium]|nr:Crp/Fnr family transcriptional regulator [Deltaproteobacteria bacterium]